MTTIEERRTNPIVAAATALLGRGDDGGVPVNRNGAGFNKVDYPLARSILAGVARQDGVATRGQLRGLLTVLRKYRRQLAELGFDPAAMEAAVAEGAQHAPAPPVAEPPAWAPPEPEPEPAVVGRGPRALPPMAEVLGPGGAIARRLPGYEARPSQVEVAQAIADAIGAEEPILAEAGTGTGKSLAYLVPAILSGRRTIVSTEGKALQDQLVGKDLPFLRAALPEPFEFAALKGIGNYVCLDRWHEEAAKQRLIGESHGFAALRPWLEATETGDLAEAPVAPAPDLRAAITVSSDECLGADCPFAARCFALRARRRAERADVVVVNHTLLALDLALRDRTEDGASILPDRDLVVIDEAHALEDVATKAFTDEASESAVPAALSGRLPGLARFEPGDVKAAHEASERLFAVLHRDERQAFRVTPNDELRERAATLAGMLRAFARQARAAALDVDETTDRRRLERYGDRLATTADTVMRTCAEPPEDEIVYAEFERTRADRRVAVLKRAPVAVADDLRRALWRRWPVVATSATLTTSNGFGYVQERTGCDRARTIAVESPFDYRRNALIYLPPDGGAFDPSLHRQDGSVAYFDRLAGEIERLLLASDGRAFCLFTSRRAMDEVHDRIAYRLRWTVLKQGDYGTQEAVRRFREDGRAVLFGLRSFWTGVDVQGEALSLVIVDKLPFPTPDEPVYQARCDLLNRQTGDRWAWFKRLALPMATMQFKQGAGRLIRSQADRGVLALLDGRLTTKGYGTGILRALPPAPVTRSIEAVEAFFAAGAGR